MSRITVTVDGVSYTDEVEPRTLLVHYLRETVGKTGTVVGCDTSNCGACTVHLDGTSVKSCNVLAVQADGHEVTTIEGLAQNGELHPMQKAFHECHALQCGYCTPGMIMQACDVLKEHPDPTRAGDPRGPRGQPLPVHGLPQHRQGRAAGGRRAELAGGVLVTITDDRPDTTAPELEIGKARRRKEDQRLITGRTRWTDNIQLPGMLHLAMVRSPFAHATITAISTRPRPRRHPESSTSSRARTSRTSQGAIANAWPLNGEQKTPDHLPVVVEHVACAGEIVAVVAARTAAAGARRSRARRRRLRGAAGRPRPQGGRQGRGARAPRPRHEHLGDLDPRLREPRAPAPTSRRRSREAREDGIVLEREFRQQRLIPAFMEPRSTVCDPTGEQMTVWTSTQVPAHPALPRRRDDRHTGVEGARHRPRRRRRLRRQAADDARGVRDHRGRAPPRQAVQVHRDPVRVAALGPPRPRPVAEADAQRSQGRHASRASRSSCSPTSAPTSASSAAACRCSVRGCSTRSTSSRPTTSPCAPC